MCKTLWISHYKHNFTQIRLSCYPAYRFRLSNKWGPDLKLPDKSLDRNNRYEQNKISSTKPAS